MRTAARSPYLQFALLASAVLLAEHALLASPPLPVRGDLVAFALTVDLTLFLPVAFWLLVVRRGAAPPATALALFLLGLSAAAALLPPDRQAWPGRIALLSLPAEGILALLLVRRALRLRRGLRTARLQHPDFADAFAQAMDDALGSGRVTRLLTAELLVLHFALFSWGRRGEEACDAPGYTHHRACGWTAVFAALALAIVAEALALHFLVRTWSPRAAWVLTGLSLYSLAWLTGDGRALALRRTRIRGDTLELRVGLRWQADIPLAAIRAFRPFASADALCTGYLRTSVLGAPKVLLELRNPVEVEGPLGRRCRASSLGLQVDGDELGEELAARGVGRGSRT